MKAFLYMLENLSTAYLFLVLKSHSEPATHLRCQDVPISNHYRHIAVDQRDPACVEA